MSREVIIKIRDDLDGSDADETVTFSYRGASYEIDLSSTNVERFDKTMQEWVDVARLVDSRQAATAKKPSWPQKPPERVLAQRRQIRAWADENGFKHANRGIIAQTIVEAFQAANPDVVLFPATVMTANRAKSPVVTSVTAQEAENGLLTISELTASDSDARSARDRRRERESKRQRDVIRAWGIEHGFDQASTGKVKEEVVDAYHAAHRRSASA